MEIEEKIVNFKNYCPKCKYMNKKGNDEPCDTCLGNPVNILTKKPVKFEEAKDEKGK